MDGKIVLQDIVDLLAQRQGITLREAETFVKAMFSLIEEMLEREKCVKIKGLGIFKIIEVASRESININNGERFEIRGHSKISFVPDPVVRDLINKPFAHFEAVSLHEETVLEGMSEATDTILNEPEGEAAIGDIPAKIADTEDGSAREEKLSVVSETVSDRTVTGEKDNRECEKRLPEEAGTSYFSVKEEVAVCKMPNVRRRNVWYVIGILCLVSIVVYMFCCGERASTNPAVFRKEKPELKMQQADSAFLSKDTCWSDSTGSLVSTKEVPDGKRMKQDSADTKTDKATVPVLSIEEGNYKIVGTLQTHTIQIGETLRKISLKYYGTKELFFYIVQYNQDVIKNPDNVPVGVVIRIPELRQK